MAQKLLIVDDEADTLRLVSLMLERQGYEILTAKAGKTALEKVESDKPDLILLDVMMPNMDGFEVAKALRSDPETENIPIIMFTAKTRVDDKVAGFEAGADDYIKKPFDLSNYLNLFEKYAAAKTPVITYIALNPYVFSGIVASGVGGTDAMSSSLFIVVIILKSVSK